MCVCLSRSFIAICPTQAFRVPSLRPHSGQNYTKLRLPLYNGLLSAPHFQQSTRKSQASTDETESRNLCVIKRLCLALYPQISAVSTLIFKTIYNKRFIKTTIKIVKMMIRHFLRSSTRVCVCFRACMCAELTTTTQR